LKYAKRMSQVQKSFVREILKVTEKKEVISFAGGLPNPDFFPTKEIAEASSKILKEDGSSVLQYSTTEGYKPLREFIVDRYYKGCGVSADEILITNGSQQALDLIGKVFLDLEDGIVIEKPGYLGAIQAFSIFEPKFHTVTLNDDGIDIEELERVLIEEKPKLFYAVTNFQNPTGISYSEETRTKLAKLMKAHDTILIDDNPYGELCYKDQVPPSMISLMQGNMIALGSFSKVFSPGMRLGWICAPKEIIEKITIAKQASDLHTNYFSQRLLFQYLTENNLDEHISHIRQAYKERKDFMVKCLEKELPSNVKYTNPDGGMFLWVTLPEGASSMKLFEEVSAKDVAFVPGIPFYINCNDINTLRMNYTNSSFEEIEKGVKIFAEVIKKS